MERKSVGAPFAGIYRRKDTTVHKKRNSGITLIALVITIIIMLILAGIVITLSIGNNGIIVRTQQAGKNYLDAQNKEEVELAKLNNEINQYVSGDVRSSTSKISDNLLEEEKVYNMSNTGWTTVGDTVTLKDSIFNYDEIVFDYYTITSSNNIGWKAQSRFLVKLIGYSDSNTDDGGEFLSLNGALTNGGTTAQTFSASFWFKDERTIYFDNTGTSSDTMKKFVLKGVYGIKY